MKNKSWKRPLLWLRNIALILLSPILIFALVEAYVFVASIWGRETILVEGSERTYRVYLPPSYSRAQPAPLILAFHMYSGSGRTMEWLTHFNQVADENGFIVVYPDGYEGSWADGSNAFAADRDGIDDVAFVSALLDRLILDYSIDTTRIYTTGFSSGGFLAQRLACELPDRIAAVAVVGATLANNVLPNCNPQLPVPIMMIHGAADHSVTWEGTPEEAAVPETIAHWVTINGCNDAPDVVSEPDLVGDGTSVRRETYNQCQDDAEVAVYIIENGAHAWPGGDRAIQLWGITGKISNNLDASAVIWDFFQGHHR